MMFRQRRAVALVALSSLLSCGAPEPAVTTSTIPVTVAPADQIPGTNLTPGSVASSHEVGHKGHFAYSVPLWVVPGRAGMQPSLALSYTNNGPTTHLGRGFALAGESAISRCQKSFVRDGVPSSVMFDNSDAFCVDGSRLVLVSGSNGKPGAEYVVEIEDNRKIVIDSADALGPVAWTVYQPSGVIERYGITLQHRLEGARRGGRQMAAPLLGMISVPLTDGRLRWLRATTTDRYGNGIRYDYAIPDARTERTLQRIEYTTQTQAGAPAANRFVDFTYEYRGVSAFSYVNGLRIDQTQLLRRIQVSGPKSAGIGPVYRYYALAYTTGMTGEPLLQSFSECDHIGICKRPVAFGWTTDSTALDAPFVDYNTGLLPFGDPAPNHPYSNTERIHAGDFTGDGADDLLVLDRKSQWNVLPSNFGPNGTNAFVTPIIAGTEGALISGGVRSLPYEHLNRFTDLNFDGRLDLMQGGPATNPAIPANYFLLFNQYWNCVTTASSTFSCSFRDPWITFNAPSLYLSDFDGNGRTDMLQHRPTSPTGIDWTSDVVFDLEAGGAYTPSSVTDSNGTTVHTANLGPMTYLVDLDDDQRVEVVHPGISTSSGAPKPTDYLEAYSLDAAGIATPRTMNLPVGLDQCQRRIFSDATGDGLADVILTSCTHAPDLAVNTGDGFLPAVRTTPVQLASTHPVGDDGLRLIDINRDGREDLLYTFPTTSGTVMALVSTPNANFRSLMLRARDPHTGIAHDIPAGDRGEGGTSISQVLDVNGDGADDFIQFVAGQLHVYVAESRPVDQLATIAQVDAQDELRISYVSGNDHAIVGLMAQPTAVFPQVEGTGRGLWVVRDVVHSNGAGGSQLTESHTYHRPVVDLHEGFVGFAGHTVTDLASTTTFTFDLARKPVGTIAYAARNVPIVVEKDSPDGTGRLLRSETRAAVSVVDGRVQGRTVRILPTSTTTARYHGKPNGWMTLYQRTQTSSNFDAYGNARSVRVDTIDPGVGTHVLENEITYDNYDAGAAWMLGRATASTSISTDASGRSATRTSASTYDSKTGALLSSTREPGNPALYLESRFIPDQFGNLARTELRDAAGAMRAVNLGYDNDYVYITSRKNPLQQSEYAVVQLGFGTPMTLTNADGISINQQLDTFGRVKQIFSPTGEVTTTTFSDGNAFASLGVVDSIERRSNSKTGTSITYHDGFGRVVFEDATDLHGNTSRISYKYDPTRGWLESRTGPEPFPPVSGQASPKLVVRRDPMGRPIEIDDSGAITKNAYDGLTRTTTDPSGRTSSETFGAVGIKSVRRLDPPRKPLITAFEYGPFGLATKVTQRPRNGAAQISTYEHDPLGRVSATTDDAMTTTRYTYTPFSEVSLVTDVDKNGVVTLETETTFDDLGRMLSFTDLTKGTFENHYTYDPPNATGQMSTATSKDGVATAYVYDSLGRIESETTAYKGETYMFQHSYDWWGRSDRLVYPITPFGAVEVHQQYDGITGVPSGQTSASVPGGSVWTLQEMDHLGNITDMLLGNNLVDRRGYDLAGRLTSARTDLGPTKVRDLSYGYYANGNMLHRTDLLAGVQERFTHDFLDRLSSVGYYTGDILKYQDTTDYDDFGNITTRSRETEVMKYAYNTGPGPHGNNAVTELHSPVRDMLYRYDGRGNQVEASGSATVGGVQVPAAARSITYTSFDLPRSVVQDEVVNGTSTQTTTNYAYDAFNQRFATDHVTTGELVIERGTGFRRTRQNGTDRWQMTLQGPFGPVATIVKSASGTDVTYLHAGALGSLDTETDSAGAVVSRRSYTPWGEVRTSTLPMSPMSPLAIGFTGHTHDAGDIVNMGGRLYDSLSARFLSKDPRNPRPLDAQSYNRYSYVLGAPLALVDPTGFEVEQDWGDAHRPSPIIAPPDAGLYLGDNISFPVIRSKPAPAAIAPRVHEAATAAAPATIDDEPEAPTNLYQMMPDDTVDKILAKNKVSLPVESVWINVPDGNGVKSVPNGQSIPVDAERWAGSFDLSIWNAPALGSSALERYTNYRNNFGDATYEEYLSYASVQGTAAATWAPWELFSPGGRVARVAPVAQITLNRNAGNAFRDAIAAQMTAIGMEVEREVTYRTVCGLRYADVVVSHNGVRLFTIETKLGMSRYYAKQQMKDALIWLDLGLPTFMKRSGSVPQVNWGAMIHRTP